MSSVPAVFACRFASGGMLIWLAEELEGISPSLAAAFIVRGLMNINVLFLELASISAAIAVILASFGTAPGLLRHIPLAIWEGVWTVPKDPFSGLLITLK